MDGGTTFPCEARRLGDKLFCGAAAAIVFIAYLAVMKVAGLGWSQAAQASLINLISLAVVAIPTGFLLVRYLATRGPWGQVGAHVALAPIFSGLWYWTMMVLIGVSDGASATRFVVRPFPADAAVAWQLLQGVTFYALFGVLVLWRARDDVPSFVIAAPADEGGGKGSAFSRYFIRRGDEIHPVDVAEIVSITGADDYAEVATTTGRHLVRMTLGDFERVLESDKFIRAHRSRIINVERMLRAEPAGGGRMLLHMEDGEIVQASRTGTRLLRDRVL
jgi:hypothetical protein